MPIPRPPKRALKRKKRRYAADHHMPVTALNTIAGIIKQFQLAISSFKLDVIQFTYNTNANQMTVIFQGNLPQEDRDFRANILRKRYKFARLYSGVTASTINEQPILSLRVSESQTSGSSTMFWVLDANDAAAFELGIQILEGNNAKFEWRWEN